MSENYDQFISKNKHYDSKELYLTMQSYFAFCEALFRRGRAKNGVVQNLGFFYLPPASFAICENVINIFVKM